MELIFLNNFNLLTSLTITAVSYTHLDVYKRQPLKQFLSIFALVLNTKSEIKWTKKYYLLTTCIIKHSEHRNCFTLGSYYVYTLVNHVLIIWTLSQVCNKN